METIDVAESNAVYDSRDNCNALIKTEDNTLMVGGNKTIIPDSVTKIDSYAFWGMEGLTKINIPQGLRTIGYGAFKGCTGLQEIVFPGDSHFVGEAAFENCTGLKMVKVIVNIGIRSGAFNGCENLKEIWLPDTIDKNSIVDKEENSTVDIYRPPFDGCTQLTIVTPKDSYAQAYAVEHNIPYRNEDIWPIGDDSGKKTDETPNDTSDKDDKTEIKDGTEKKSDTPDNKKEDAVVGQNQQQEQPAVTGQQDATISSDESPADNVTTFNIKNKKTYKKSKIVTVKDSDGIKSIKLNGKTIKVKAGKKSISFKLSKYKKYLKKKTKWNKLVVTDVNGNKKTIQFKVK